MYFRIFTIFLFLLFYFSIKHIHYLEGRSTRIRNQGIRTIDMLSAVPEMALKRFSDGLIPHIFRVVPRTIRLTRCTIDLMYCKATFSTLNLSRRQIKSFIYFCSICVPFLIYHREIPSIARSRIFSCILNIIMIFAHINPSF